MYPKFKEIALDTATWTVAFLGAIEERETKSKKPFCTFHLLDGDIAITANLWNTEKKDIYKVQEKSVISVQLYKKLYNGVETYEVKEYQAAPDDAKLEDYLLTAPIPSQDMMDEIKSILSKEISETELYPLVMGILDENADKLLYWAAAKTIHHNCYGGLLYHMLRMLKTAVILSRVYRFDKELLYSAVILHDIGKLQELDTDATGVAEYTVDGNLFGHTLLAIEMIDRKSFENPTYPAEKIRLLKHCIVAHHGQLEYRNTSILYRTNKEAVQVSDLLITEKIPFWCTEPIQDKYDHWIYRDILSYHKLGNGIGNKMDLNRILNHCNLRDSISKVNRHRRGCFFHQRFPQFCLRIIRIFIFRFTNGILFQPMKSLQKFILHTRNRKVGVICLRKHLSINLQIIWSL